MTQCGEYMESIVCTLGRHDEPVHVGMGPGGYVCGVWAEGEWLMKPHDMPRVHKVSFVDADPCPNSPETMNRFTYACTLRKPHAGIVHVGHVDENRNVVGVWTRTGFIYEKGWV